ncbi:ankyrin repeat-containing protein At5g02620-like [Humulus lupulus]|uniref:ankyrin repeat-containing protein At5g02620-like n=1 Tax=Humulus lupulus TaxID=3486 RepID=UPI002B401091|nr:ankyrin repeat-containing protein At5g02620-like [Humulus lupulus]
MDPELYNAAIYGSSELSEKLTEEGSNIYLGQVTSQNNTILHVAAKSGQRKLAEDVLYSNSLLLYETNTKGNTALHIAARLGHLEMVRLIVNKAKEQDLEADRSLLRMTNSKGDTALHEAVRNDHYEVAILIIDEDRDLTCFVNNIGESPLFLAVDRGFYKVALHILETAPKCSYVGRNGMNALHAAVIRTHKSKQFKSTEKKTPSLWKKIPYIDKFTGLNLKFPLSRYELNITGADFVGNVLKKCPSSMLEADDFGWMPLHYAAHLGNVEVVELFLEINHSSITYVKDNNGMSALHIAAKEGHVNVMRSIVTKCPDTCESLDDRDRTALHVAVETSKKNAVKFFLQTLAFQDLINEQDKEGNTPLHLAAFQGHSKILEILARDPRVDKGALNKDGMTTLDIIRSSKQLRELEILKTLSMATLEIKGALPSLEQKVIRDAAEAKALIGEDFQEHEKGKSKMLEASEIYAADKYKDDEPELSSQGYRPLDITNMSSINLIVSTIISAVTFAAAFTMPGGYNEQGIAISSEIKAFKMFLLFDSLAFGCSAASMFVHFLVAAWPRRLRFIYPIYCVTILTELSLVGLALAFVHGALAVFPQNSGLANMATNSVLLSFSIPIIYFFLKIIYSIYYLFKAHGLPSKKAWCTRV